MLGSDVAALRERFGFTEDEMAKRMGLSLAKYLALEGSSDRISRLHTLVLERVALSVAVERKEPEAAPPSIRRVVLRYASIVLEANRPAAE